MNTLRTDRATVTAWALWDWGSAAFNAVLVTFIFSVYLTDSVGTTLDSRYTPTTLYGLVMAVAGVLISVVAQIFKQHASLKGTRRRSQAVWTFITIALMFSLFTVRNDAPVYFWVGAVIMAVASVLFEFAEVNYYAQLKQISTPENVGRVSGFGWGMGYAGGIVLLLICYFGFVAGEGGMFGLPTEGGLNIRLVAVFAAVWFAVFAIPVLVRVPEIRPSGAADTEGVLDAYRRLLHTIRDLWRADRNALYFLFSSAVFRDGLAGVFTFGAILAVTVYGLTPGDVLLFGVAANVAAAAGAMLGGFLDDILGPKPIIIASLVLMIASAGVLYFVEGPQMFWIFGLILCLFVGPAQSAARSFLSRVAPDGREGQLFGLYVTTGRAVSWLSPLAFGLFVLLGGADRFGILGIGLILLVGALLLIPVVDPTRRAR